MEFAGMGNGRCRKTIGITVRNLWKSLDMRGIIVYNNAKANERIGVKYDR